MSDTASQDVFGEFATNYSVHSPEELTLKEYLERCRTDPDCYATAAQRMLKAIGLPDIVDTSKDPRDARLFGNKEIRRYPAFSDFYGMEETIESIVDFFRHAAQGLEESKQIIYLLGPVGGGKSSLVDRIRKLMESLPIYVLAYKTNLKEPAVMSPYFSQVLPLFGATGMGERITKEYGIPSRYLEGIIGPWERKRLEESKGNLSNFRVVKVYPSRFQQLAISEAEPGDENTQDISTLVGKCDMRKLEEFSLNDPDAYLYSGALNKANQGILEFKEMFKAKIKMLNPLLFAVQEHNYQGTENLGAMPFYGIVCAHSNEAEWLKFRNNKDNEAFIDRVCVIKVPYCTRVNEEIQIYKKMLEGSDLADKPIAPGTLEVLAMFSVISRIREPQGASWYSKMRVYNGENLREKDQHAKTYQEYKDNIDNREEGFYQAISTRWAFKRISQCFNSDAHEIAADPIYMMNILLNEIKKDLTPEQEAIYERVIKDILNDQYYYPFIDREIRSAYLESYTDYGQNLFDRYILYADHWIRSEDYNDTDVGLVKKKDELDAELQKIEKQADVTNARDFRNEVVNYCLRYAAKNDGKKPSWKSYEKLKEVIEKTMFANTKDLLPVISFSAKSSAEEEKKHGEFVDRMMENGYTERQIRRVVDWYMRAKSTK
jgi:serine protein kinase